MPTTMRQPSAGAFFSDRTTDGGDRSLSPDLFVLGPHAGFPTGTENPQKRLALQRPAWPGPAGLPATNRPSVGSMTWIPCLETFAFVGGCSGCLWRNPLLSNRQQENLKKPLESQEMGLLCAGRCLGKLPTWSFAFQARCRRRGTGFACYAHVSHVLDPRSPAFQDEETGTASPGLGLAHEALSWYDGGDG